MYRRRETGGVYVTCTFPGVWKDIEGTYAGVSRAQFEDRNVIGASGQGLRRGSGRLPGAAVDGAAAGRRGFGHEDDGNAGDHQSRARAPAAAHGQGGQSAGRPQPGIRPRFVSVPAPIAIMLRRCASIAISPGITSARRVAGSITE